MIENKLFNEQVLLLPLTNNDSDRFYELYSHPQLTANFDESPFLLEETPEEFTRRIESVCEFIFTIRLKDDPSVIIGDCALHHWNKQSKEISIGGSLFPEYWGKGYMQAAFELLISLAKQELGIKTLLGQTQTRNTKAIRLVEKMGFVKWRVEDQETLLRKEL